MKWNDNRLAHTRRSGRVVSIGDMPTPEVATELGKPWLAPVFWLLSRRPRAAARAQGVAYRYWFMREDGARLAMLLDRLARGKLQVHIEQEYSLAQAPEALPQSEAGRVRGKLVIRPWRSSRCIPFALSLSKREPAGSRASTIRQAHGQPEREVLVQYFPSGGRAAC